MKATMRTVQIKACVALAMLAAASSVPAQAPSDSTPRQEGAIPLTSVIAAVAKKTGKKFVVDPRVRGDVLLIGQDPSTLDYAGLQTVLQVHGFIVADGGDLVRIVPDAVARQLASPLITGKETPADAQYATKIIPVKSMPAAQLVPLLRPMLPQQAHLAAVVCTNALMMVDTFDNVKRIERIVQSLETNERYTPKKCVAHEAATKEGSQDVQ